MAETKARATDRPWRVGTGDVSSNFEGPYAVIATRDGAVFTLAVCNTNFPEESAANAALIVSSVNAAPHAESLANAVLAHKDGPGNLGYKQIGELVELAESYLKAKGEG